MNEIYGTIYTPSPTPYKTASEIMHYSDDYSALPPTVCKSKPLGLGRLVLYLSVYGDSYFLCMCISAETGNSHHKVLRLQGEPYSLITKDFLNKIREAEEMILKEDLSVPLSLSQNSLN